jgi:hypothetical protein
MNGLQMRYPLVTMIYTLAFEDGPPHPLRRIGKSIREDRALVVLRNQRIEAASLGATDANLYGACGKGSVIRCHESFRSRRARLSSPCDQARGQRAEACRAHRRLLTYFSLIVAIVKVVRFGFGYAGRGNSRPHDDVAIGGKLDRFHRVFRSRSRSEDATDNALMMEHFAFAPPLKSVELTGTRGTHRNCLKMLYHIIADGATGKCRKPLIQLWKFNSVKRYLCLSLCENETRHNSPLAISSKARPRPRSFLPP